MTLGHRHHKKRPSTFGAGGFSVFPHSCEVTWYNNSTMFRQPPICPVLSKICCLNPMFHRMAGKHLNFWIKSQKGFGLTIPLISWYHTIYGWSCYQLSTSISPWYPHFQWLFQPSRWWDCNRWFPYEGDFPYHDGGILRIPNHQPTSPINRWIFFRILVGSLDPVCG